MRNLLPLVSLAVFAVAAGADDGDRPSMQKEYIELSRLIHKIVAREIPKEFEDRSGWGTIVPLTEKLRFPNLPRTRIRIGDKEGYPDGLWKKYKVRIEEPAKDLKINVREFSKIDPKTFRLALDSEIAVAGAGEVQNWQKGLALGKLTADANAVFSLGMAFDVGITLNTKKFPPEVIVEPKIIELQVDLKDFILRRVANPTTNLALEGETAKNIGDEMKDTLKGLIKSYEPDIKLRANEAIAKSLKEGKGNISAATLMKIAPPIKN